MPALLTVINNGNSDSVDGTRWRAGEAVNNLDGHVFGWFEMPKNYLGPRSVADINAADLSNIEPYTVVEMTDGGVITEGHTVNGFEPMVVQAGDAIVLQFDDTVKFWTGFGPRPANEYSLKHRFHWRVSDKTTEEMQVYMETLHKSIQMTVVAGPDPQGLRRIEVDNLYLTASGGNAFTQEGVDDIKDTWNAEHPDSNLIEYAPLEPGTIYFEGTFTSGEAQEFEDTIIELGFADLYNQRRWYINSQGMTALANNDGFMNTTASELGQVFRDGLLD